MGKHRIFLDTADVAQIKDAVSTGLIDGIATNPAKIAATGKTYRRVLEEIRAFFDGPVSFQALGNSAEELVEHARDIHRMDPNLAVKIAADRKGLTAVARLVKEGVRTNATLIFNPAQALLAGLAGSPFVSPFIGRANMAGHDGIGGIRTMRALFDAWRIDACMIIAASIKDVEQVIGAVTAGAHCVAVPYHVFEAMMGHPLTEQGIERFTEEYGRTLRSAENQGEGS